MFAVLGIYNFGNNSQIPSNKKKGSSITMSTVISSRKECYEFAASESFKTVHYTFMSSVETETACSIYVLYTKPSREF